MKSLVNKKVLLRERKRHTACRVASADGKGGTYLGQGGYLPWGTPHPDLARGRGTYLGWGGGGTYLGQGGGVLPWGTPALTWPEGGGTYLGWEGRGTYFGVPLRCGQTDNL